MSSDSKPNSSLNSEEKEKVKTFTEITKCDLTVAENLLKACNFNIDMAISMHMDSVPEAGSSNIANSAANWENEEEVRAPLPQVAQVLVEPGYEGYAMQSRMNRRTQNNRGRVRTVFDGFSNFGEEGKSQSLPVNQQKKKTLEDLYKRPLDIMHKGDFDSAKRAAVDAKKWLIVSIHDASEFMCQVLNRDIWSNEVVKKTIRDQFIFWQQFKETDDAERFCMYYKITSYPNVSVLDPRTGEKFITWHEVQSVSKFLDLVSELLALHPGFDEKQIISNSLSKREKSDSQTQNGLIDAGEDAQIQAAIRASLLECGDKRKITTDDENYDLTFQSSDDEETASYQKCPAKKPKISKEETCTEHWTAFLGDDKEEKSTIMIRYPDGNRKAQEFPKSSKLKAVFLFLESTGFPLEDYEIVTNFPKKNISNLDENSTLEENNLTSHILVFVQSKNSDE